MKFERILVVTRGTKNKWILEEASDPDVAELVTTLYLDKQPLKAGGIERPLLVRITLEVE